MAISEDDHAKIAEAVARAEGGTSGEIRCVLAVQTGNPAIAALSAGALAALAAPAVAVLLGFRPDVLADSLRGWSATSQVESWLLVGVYGALQAMVFSVVTGLGLIPAFRRLITPAPIRRARVRRAAEAQFAALGLTHTRDRTGVLLYASLAERRVEVLADAGIWEKTTPADWEHVADLLTGGLRRGQAAEGFLQAVDAAGALLKAKLPVREGDTNELPDGLTLQK